MIRYQTLENDFEYIEIQNSVATAKISLQGAHVFSYVPEGKQDLLWLSNTAHFKEGVAIRGGIPICWPWFGPHEEDSRLKQHGFARTALWSVESYEESDTSSTVILALQDTAETMLQFPHAFDLKLKITVSDTLSLSLTTTNLSSTPMKITTALHSYLHISDIASVQIEGLEDQVYFDLLSKCISY